MAGLLNTSGNSLFVSLSKASPIDDPDLLFSSLGCSEFLIIVLPLEVFAIDGRYDPFIVGILL